MKPKEGKQFLVRMRVVFGFMVLAGFVLIANLFYIQITNGSRFRAQADGQYVVSTYNSFERGSIYLEDKDGTRVTAAGQKSGYKVSINPSTFSADPDDITEKIQSIVPDFDPQVLIDALSRENRTYVEIVNQLNKEDGEALKEILGKAAQLHAEKWRVYPLGGSAAHVLGFLGYEGDDYNGRYGLERQYEDTLKREDVDVYTNFFARIFQEMSKTAEHHPRCRAEWRRLIG